MIFGAARVGCPLLLWFERPLVLEQSTQIHLALEVGLGTGGDGSEYFGIRVPGGDAFMVCATMLIVDDEWDNLMSEAFLHHDQSAEATIAVFEGMDAFEADVEI